MTVQFDTTALQCMAPLYIVGHAELIMLSIVSLRVILGDSVIEKDLNSC